MNEKMDGERLRMLREARGWTHLQLANAAHMTPGTIGNLERGRNQPTAITLINLARAFGLSLSDFAAELGLIERASAPGSMPPEVVSAVRRALVHGVPTSALCQAIDIVIVGFASSQPGNEAAAIEPTAKRGRVV